MHAGRRPRISTFVKGLGQLVDPLSTCPITDEITIQRSDKQHYPCTFLSSIQFLAGRTTTWAIRGYFAGLASLRELIERRGDDRRHLRSDSDPSGQRRTIWPSQLTDHVRHVRQEGTHHATRTSPVRTISNVLDGERAELRPLGAKKCSLCFANGSAGTGADSPGDIEFDVVTSRNLRIPIRSSTHELNAKHFKNYTCVATSPEQEGKPKRSVQNVSSGNLHVVLSTESQVKGNESFVAQVEKTPRGRRGGGRWTPGRSDLMRALMAIGLSLAVQLGLKYVELNCPDYADVVRQHRQIVHACVWATVFAFYPDVSATGRLPHLRIDGRRGGAGLLVGLIIGWMA
jgi:hypothetical protein